MIFSINSVIYFYIFICVALLFFNILYILRTGERLRAEERRVRRWTERLNNGRAAGTLSGKEGVERTVKKLSDIRELTAFYSALEAGAAANVGGWSEAAVRLAAVYLRRSPVERAFFAYVIAKYPPEKANVERLSDMLLQFLENSTVYCRENVLEALCALGDPGAVEQALALFNERGWYHHSRMISDGLTAFKGDRPALAARLWEASRSWDENLRVAAVQFASNVADGMKGPLFEALASGEPSLEVRFAIIRYFTRHPYEPARPLLQRTAEEEGETAVAACRALARYPGGDTEAVLEKAVLSRSWYVRHSAALSLVMLGAEEAAYTAAKAANDRYALEMLDYITGREKEATTN